VSLYVFLYFVYRLVSPFWCSETSFIPRCFTGLRIFVYDVFVCKHFDGTIDLFIYIYIYMSIHFWVFVMFTCVFYCVDDV
jgi:hypothetical protein